MLPAVTCEDIETAVNLLQFLRICQIELKGLVAAQLSVFLKEASAVLNLIVVRNLTLIIRDVPARSGGYVETEIQISTKTIKELEFIVELGITYETAYIRTLVLFIKLEHRV